jgi:hypothetical protein
MKKMKSIEGAGFQTKSREECAPRFCRLRLPNRSGTIKGMSRGGFIPFILLFCSVLSAPEAWSMACNEKCPEQKTALEAKIVAKDRMKAVLERNEAFLKNNPNVNPSIIMKIQSNKIIARLEIETLENEIVPLKEFVEKEGCSQCQ